MISDFLRAGAGADVPAVAAIVSSADDTLYLGAFGKRDVAADVDATPDTIFRIASMTKPITSLAVMMLRDDGRIALDDPITKHLTDYVVPPVVANKNSDGTFQTRPASRPMTIAELLTNTSGIAYPFFDAELTRLVSSGVPILELPLLHDPGMRWTYGASTAVLGRMVAQVSGESLDAFCQTRIFDPLGMNDTGYAVAAKKRDRVVTQHQRTAGTLVERPNPAVIQSKGRGDDGLFSTVSDYAAFLRLLLNGGTHGGRRLVSEDAVRMMTTNRIGALRVQSHVAVNPAIARPFPPGAGKDTFGFGFQIETAPSDAGMRSAGSFSWSGIFNTYFWGDPVQKIAAVLMMQLLPANDSKPGRLLAGFERRVYS